MGFRSLGRFEVQGSEFRSLGRFGVQASEFRSLGILVQVLPDQDKMPGLLTMSSCRRRAVVFCRRRRCGSGSRNIGRGRSSSSSHRRRCRRRRRRHSGLIPHAAFNPSTPRRLL